MFDERYDEKSGTGENHNIEIDVLKKFFSKVSKPVKEKEYQIMGYDYICGKDNAVVDAKIDHAMSKGDFVFELTDKHGHSWTEADCHDTDFICWIKYYTGYAYLIPMENLVALSKTELFKKRHTFNIGEGAQGKFFKLGTELPYCRRVAFDTSEKLSLTVPMNDYIKFSED